MKISTVRGDIASTLGVSTPPATKPNPSNAAHVIPGSPAAVTNWLRHPENEEVAAKIEAQEGFVARGRALTNANYHLVQDAQSDLGDAQGMKSRVIESYANTGMAVPPDEMHSLEEAIAKKKRILKDLMADSAKVTGGLVGDREALKAVVKYLPDLVAWSPVAQPIEVDLPEGNLAEIVAAQRATILELRKTRREVRNAPPHPSEIEANLLAKLADLAREGAPRVSFSNGMASLRLPVVGIDAEPNSIGHSGGSLPSAPDAHGLAAYFFHDQLAQIIKAEVAQHYKDLPVTLSAAEKRHRTADIEASILQATRVECAAIYHLRDQGISFAFRADTDPRALLGVDGPAPRRRKE